MAEQAVKDHIRDSLRNAYFNKLDDLVDVSDGDGDNIHIVVVSRQLGGKRAKEKTDLLWSILTQNLPPEQWGKITLVTATTPEELKAL